MEDDVEFEVTDSEFANERQNNEETVVIHEIDQDMEEGEISGNENEKSEQVDFGRHRRGRLSGRLGPRPVAFNDDDLSKSYLPDLVREIGVKEISSIDRASTEKMMARAKRFQLESNAVVGYEDVVKMYDSLKIPVDEREPCGGDDGEKERRYRLTAVHMTGFNSKVDAHEIEKYFEGFSPIALEWVSPTSANIIWAIPISAAKALCTLSRPFEANPEPEVDEEQQVMVQDADEGQNSAAQMKEKLLAKFDQPSDTVVRPKEIGDMAAFSNGPWRIGKPSNLPNLCESKAIFMRFATKDDGDVESVNRQQPPQGGLWSSSMKRRIQRIVEFDQQNHEEYEMRKKYTGPVGSNPWGGIAEDWSGHKRAAKRDFNEDLQILASQMRNGPRNDSPLKRGHGKKRDWDEPDGAHDSEYVDADAPFSTRKRTRERSGSPQARTLKLSELNDRNDDDTWTKKLKKPRMAMVADSVDPKKKTDVKARIYKHIRREVPNARRSERLVEEVDDDFDDEDSRLRMRIEAKKRDKQLDRYSNLNVRFGDGSRLSHKLKSRLGDHRRVEAADNDSGDSLERDNGEGLRGLDLGEAANMLIQVTRSDDEEEEDGRNESSDEAMETEAPRPEAVKKAAKKAKDGRRDDRDEDNNRRRKDSDHRALSRVSSQVVKVKSERAEEERKAREARRRKERDEEAQVWKKREAAEIAAREARRRERSERRTKADHDERRRRREHERRREESRTAKRKGKPSTSKASGSRDERKRASVRIKKEKVTDDENSSSDSSSSSSSSDSDSDSDSSSSSSSSSSDSSSSGSSSDSDSSDSGRERRKKAPAKKTPKSGKGEAQKKNGDEAKKGSKDDKGLKDKLTEYLKQAKERRKKGGGK